MSRNLKFFIIVISLLSIFFSVYLMYKDQKIFYSLGGIVVGLSLLAALYFDNYKKKK